MDTLDAQETLTQPLLTNADIRDLINQKAVFEHIEDMDSLEPETHYEQKHLKTWLQLLPNHPDSGQPLVADIGGGVGIEAEFLQQHGCDTYLVEPSQTYTDPENLVFSHPDQVLNQDALSFLRQLTEQDKQLSGIHLNDVWVFLDPETRTELLELAQDVLLPGGSVIIKSQLNETMRIVYYVGKAGKVKEDGFHKGGLWKTNEGWINRIRTELTNAYQEAIKNNRIAPGTSYEDFIKSAGFSTEFATNQQSLEQEAGDAFDIDYIEYSFKHPISKEGRFINKSTFVAILTPKL